MIKLNQIVSTLEHPEELFVVIGFQKDIDNKENVVALLDKDKKTSFEETTRLIIHNNLTIQDVIQGKQHNKMFCYRCLKNVKPLLTIGISEYYTDIENKPIDAVLPYCPICENELYSKAYHTAAEDYKNYMIRERGLFTYEI